MKNLIVRSISGIVMVWLLLEATASDNHWYYIAWMGVAALCLVEFITLLSKHTLKHKVLWLVGGVLYIAQAAYFLLLFKELDWKLLVVLLTTVWSNDVGAYLVGISIGKHKMAPRISPKKSWEGFFGGLFFAVLVSVLWFWFVFSKDGYAFGDSTRINVALLWGAMGLFVALAAVVGDLLESYFKRKIGVKDSGKIIPGHGGMLDRFDALLLALPIFYICYTIICAL